MGCAAQTEQKQGNIEKSNVQLKQQLSLVFELPIKEGSLLSQKREDNWDYPKDFIEKDGKLFILSGEEKKIICFDTNLKQFIKYDKINTILLNEKENNSISVPLYIRITNDYIIVVYDFKLLVFSINQVLLYKIKYQTAINYLTVRGNSINIWCKMFVDQLNLEKMNYVEKMKIQFSSSKIDYTDIIVSDSDRIATQNKIFEIDGDNLVETPIKFKPYDIFPLLNKESFSMNCISSQFYVWYPWKIGSKLVLINKKSGINKIIDFGTILTKNNLSYEEDKEGGLKMTTNGINIYILIMTFEKGEKKLKVFNLPAGPR